MSDGKYQSDIDNGSEDLNSGQSEGHENSVPGCEIEIVIRQEMTWQKRRVDSSRYAIRKKNQLGTLQI